MSVLRDALRDLPDAVFADLLESDESYLVVLDLPGVTAETADLIAESGRIRIDARREKAVPMEFQYVEENRPLFVDAELPLPHDADGEAATASMERGVLEIRIPKRLDEDGQPIPIDD
ncbi:Hsp20/alpha crystallin family protein [Halalkalirubrum salinum]|uniref:Hsp20/alpha crystallin family protein n=1 Tax=Halalkalirubrum salinum TaxID=2563889 RepID=UPI0010FB67AC|nr:Hsp20/alpha crystallin family protein [Halalkalirubrum salinum]